MLLKTDVKPVKSTSLQNIRYARKRGLDVCAGRQVPELPSSATSTYPLTHFPGLSQRLSLLTQQTLVTLLLPQGNLVKSRHRALSNRKPASLCSTGLTNPYATDTQ